MVGGAVTQALEKKIEQIQCLVFVSALSLFSGFSHCFVWALSVLTLTLPSVMLCSDVPWMLTAKQTQWNDSIGIAWMSSTQDQPWSCLVFLETHSFSPCDVSERWRKGLFEQHITTRSRLQLSCERGSELLRVTNFLIVQFPDFCCSYFNLIKDIEFVI